MVSHFIIEPDAARLASCADKACAIRTAAQAFAEVYALDADDVEKRLLEREMLGSTGFGNGVALPHARMGGIRQPIAALIRLERPIDFDAADGLPVALVCALLSPEHAGATHLHALAALSRMMRDERLREALCEAPTGEALFGLIANGQDRYAA